ncbi:hypothetical protein BQ8794_30462 [Mesorhizobium prunaredense]|uniref:Uncharacterized protein n=1 Tax=Mesorhizobium prunaredense TaxID=1631249 RepID=A0A1R3VAU2_9HYPH|nr:hypothetical protein BQ8794_30462 [Mesorhizobium prunaredense]
MAVSVAAPYGWAAVERDKNGHDITRSVGWSYWLGVRALPPPRPARSWMLRPRQRSFTGQPNKKRSDC